jgi:CubicO group peptidase (beta-lactamase class C family)
MTQAIFPKIGNFLLAVLIIHFLFLFPCYSQQNAAPKNTQYILQSFDQLKAGLDSLMTKYDFPGVGIAIVTKDRILYVGGLGYADIELKKPVDENTLFRVGSISKSFVALGILKLVEQGKMTLQTPVMQICPELNIDNPWEDTHPLRVVHLLEHTSGLNDPHFNDYYLDGDSEVPLREGLKVSKHYLKLRWKPGQFRSYSSAGYMVAGIIIEKIAGLKFEDYLKKEILEPISMTESTFRLTPESEILLARGYKANYQPSKFWHTYSRPSGSMISSASEMAKFLQFMLNRGRIGEKQIINEVSINRMERSTTDPAAKAGLESTAGLGLGKHYYKGFKWYTHYGSIMGFCSAYGYCRDLEIGCALLTNRWDVDFETGIMKMWNTLRSYLIKNFEYTPQISSVPDVPATVLKSYQGYYKWCNSPQQLSVWIDRVLNYKIIKFENDSLYQKDILFGSWNPLIPLTEKTFRSGNEFWASMGFVTTSDNNIAFIDGESYYEKTSFLQVWFHIVFFILSWVIMLSGILYAFVWIPIHLYRLLTKNRHRSQYLRIRLVPLLAVVLILFSFTLVGMQVNQSIAYIGQKTFANIFFYFSTWLFAVLSFSSLFFSIKSFKKPVKPAARLYALVLSIACVGITVYWGYWGIIGLKLWAY